MTKFSKIKLLLVGIFVIPITVLIFIFVFMHFTNSFPEQKSAFNQESSFEETKHQKRQSSMFRSTYSVEDFSLTAYADNQKSFTIQGKKLCAKNRKVGIFRVALGKVAEINDVQVIFYENNEPVSHLISSDGAMDLLTKDVDFYGNIALITEDKRTLTCDSLKWDNEGEFLLAKGNCILRVEGKTARGSLIKTDVGLRNFDVTSKRTGNRMGKITKIFYGRGKR